MILAPFKFSGQKTKILPQFWAGTGHKSCGATRLDALRPLYAYCHMLTFGDGGSAPAHILRVSSVPLALGSPFSLTLSVAIPPPATLCKKGCNTYSLFLIGLGHCNTAGIICQAVKHNFLTYNVTPDKRSRMKVQNLPTENLLLALYSQHTRIKSIAIENSFHWSARVPPNAPIPPLISPICMSPFKHQRILLFFLGYNISHSISLLF